MPDRPWDDDPELHAEADTERERHRQSQTKGSGSTSRGLELVRFRDIRARLERRPLVKGMLEREQISLFFGETGCGKTFLCLDLGLRVAAGLPWFGRKVNQGAVVYLAAEAGRSIENRVAAWKRQHGFENCDIPFAVVTSPMDLCHANAGDIDRLIAAIQNAALGTLALLVIDTVSRVLAGGNENGPDDMGALVRSFDRLRDELHCHVAAVHHCGKDQSKGSRGHSLLRCAVDTETEVTRDEPTCISTAAVTKQRDGAPAEPIGFRLRQIELGVDQDGEQITSCVVEPVDALPRKGWVKAKLSPANARALKLLADAITRGGTIPPANDHIPANTQCVTEEAWREYVYQGAVSEGGQDAKRKAFSRAAGALIGHRVGKWYPWVWLIPLTRKPDEQDNNRTCPPCPARATGKITRTDRTTTP